ncbi:hypothetical protein RR46_08013 [Papilio xuthus]|uniref:DUF4781 domain-containing protein n=1 Tax=Papilio xuthus TaxID=66420 RepID=A0A194QFH0_PAPXU|nr:hypothetical protein RR46_08013 [Papilio xuthus]
MDVSESDWVTRAIENVDRYLHRGGRCQGDVPQLLGGTDLLNTIGMAMCLPFRDPARWTDAEMRLALENRLVYYEGTAREAIDVVAAQIRSCCGGDDKNFITVLPIELYYQGKLYEVPLFRVRRYKDSGRKYYVDNVGRSYDSVSDWYDNSKLPPCKMGYPHNLELKLRPGYDYSHILISSTPPARSGAQAVRAVDTVAAVAGIGSGIGLLFASGGLAAPLVVTGVATALWGTGRSTVQLADRAMHGETVNPFTNAESRMMWLGVAANLVSFGAMGASMRLASLAARGQTISNAFRIFVNVANGTTVAVSGLAILDTTVFLCNHSEDLSASDVLMHVASIAFWTKGLFTYKTAGTIIRDAENFAFAHIGRELSGDQATELTQLRVRFGDDAQLLREFYRAAREHNISVRSFSQILLDAGSHGNLQFDGRGNLILPGGQTYSFDFLSRLPGNVRQHYFDIVTNLRPDQTEVFESFRRFVNDDMNLITGLDRVASRYNVNARQATEGVIDFWRRYSQMNLPGGAEVSIQEGQLVLGTAPPISIPQLPHLSQPLVRFIGEHLSRMDAPTSRHWRTAMPVLLTLESSGLFTACPVTRIVSSGRAVVSLNGQLHVSIYRLQAMPAEECRRIFVLVGALRAGVTVEGLPPELVRLAVQRHRLRLEVHRAESVAWAREQAARSPALLRLLAGEGLLAHERDRLYTFRATVDTYKAAPYMERMLAFAREMAPRNVGELVAYCEFVVKYVETEKLAVERRLRDGTLTLPKNVRKAEWTRSKASEAVFRDTSAMRQKLGELLEVVQREDMVGAAEVQAGCGDAELVSAARGVRVRFGSAVSAAYHIFKHPTEPLAAYVRLANETIRSSATRWSVTLTQDGDARSLRFESEAGSCVLLERDGRLLLCTFSPR